MPAIATPVLAVQHFLLPFRTTLGYAERVLKDIPADKFGHMPHPTMNHPAFNIGHLSLYPNRIFTLIGQVDQVVDRPNYTQLFAAGTACVEQDGRYPQKDEIVQVFFDRHRALEKALENVPDEVLAQDNPMEGRLREMFPFVGGAVNFLLNNHTMMHLGQISAWRRAVGLPAAM